MMRASGVNEVRVRSFNVRSQIKNKPRKLDKSCEFFGKRLICA